MRRRLQPRSEEGQGLVEVTIAMSVLAIGLLTLVASYSSGFFAVSRASHTSAAAALADRTMEALRGKQYSSISTGTTTTSYTSATTPPSPDNSTYSVTTVIATATATNTTGTTARTVKTVSITVRDSAGKTWATQTSTIDPLTG
jgi:Tfp pilus assembly protein PilV